MDGDRPPPRGAPSAQAARPFKVIPPMKGGRTAVPAMAMALLLAVAGPAVVAGCQAEGAASTQEGRTTDRGATDAASAADGPQGVTTLRAWGNNFTGQLSDETTNNRTRPVKVRGLHGAKVEEIAGGQMHTLALKEDGTVLAWGYNLFGQLGNGAADNAEEAKCVNTTEPGGSQVRSSCADSPTPVRVGELDGVEAIAAGASHALALKEDGTVWAWGANDLGQLGNGMKTEGTDTYLGINTPVKIKDLSGVELVAAGLLFSFADSK